MKIFEEFNYEELPMIREEIWKWVSLADDAEASHQLMQQKHHQHRSSRSPRTLSHSSKSSDNLPPSDNDVPHSHPMSLSEIKSPRRSPRAADPLPSVAPSSLPSSKTIPPPPTDTGQQQPKQQRITISTRSPNIDLL